MKRAEAEKAIRVLCHEWRKASGNDQTPLNHLSSTEFVTWLRDSHSEYLGIRSAIGITDDIDLWFDQEFKQGWAR